VTGCDGYLFYNVFAEAAEEGAVTLMQHRLVFPVSCRGLCSAYVQKVAAYTLFCVMSHCAGARQDDLISGCKAMRFERPGGGDGRSDLNF